MKSICTLFMMALLLFGGSVTSTAQFFSASTEDGNSYSYFIKGADPRSGYNNNRYWKYDGSSAIVHTTTVPGTSDDAYKFKIYASTTNGK